MLFPIPIAYVFHCVFSFTSAIINVSWYYVLTSKGSEIQCVSVFARSIVNLANFQDIEMRSTAFERESFVPVYTSPFIVGPISISLKMIDFLSCGIFEILKSLYLRIFWDTNENRRGTNGYEWSPSFSNDINEI